MYSCQSFSFSSGSVSCCAACRSRRATTSSSLPSGISRALAPLPALSSGFLPAFSDFRSPEGSRGLCLPGCRPGAELSVSSGGASVAAVPAESPLLSAPRPSAAALPAAAPRPARRRRRRGRGGTARADQQRADQQEAIQWGTHAPHSLRGRRSVLGAALEGVVCAAEEGAQLAGHAIAGHALHARDEGQWDHRPHNGGSPGHVGADAAGGLRLLDIPDRRLVVGFLLPPAEADATRRARRCAAGDAAAA